jgi:hypothetical protein
MYIEGHIQLNGKQYLVEVIDGERFIDGKTVEEFFQSLDADETNDLAIIGIKALKDEREGRNQQNNDYQTLANKLHSRRVN